MKRMTTLTLLMGITVFSALSQVRVEKDKSNSNIEKIQDKIEAVYFNVYEIMEAYPDATYSYTPDGGEIVGVVIKDIPTWSDEKQLERYLLDLANLKKQIYNVHNRVGVYYVAETEPEPKKGYEELYDHLHKNLTYPEAAIESSIQGTVFVKFVVDTKGMVDYAVASEDINANSKWAIDKLKEEAIKSVKSTSGMWEPAKVGGIPVAHWVVVPAQFTLEKPIYYPGWSFESQGK